MSGITEYKLPGNVFVDNPVLKNLEDMRRQYPYDGCAQQSKQEEKGGLR
jgi:hypothetical protein